MKLNKLLTAIALIVALTALMVSAASARPIFTGRAPADFTEADFVFTDPVPDVGVPTSGDNPYPLGTISGWDVAAIYFDYDSSADVMYVGIDCHGICGDADGNGDPGSTSSILGLRGGTDYPDLAQSESFALAIDTNNDFEEIPDDPYYSGDFEVVVGVGDGYDINDFGTYNYTGSPSAPQSSFGTPLPNTTTLGANPSDSAPDIEFSIADFSTLPGFDFTPGEAFEFQVLLYAGSGQDDNIGEDYVFGGNRVGGDLASIGDFVWKDLNANGIQDDGDTGIGGVTVKLYDSSGFLKDTTTDASGLYSFTGLIPGDYYVEFVKPSGYYFSPKDQGVDDAKDSDADTTTGQTMVTTLISGENDMTWDAGLYRLASIGDFVWEDLNADGVQDVGEAGIAGVTVNLYHSDGTSAGSTTTDASGFYSFTGLIPGGYYLVFTKPGADYFFSPQDQGDDALDSDADTTTGQTIATTLAPGETDLTWDAGLYRPASLGDYVWHDLFHSEDHQVDGIQDNGEPGINGVVVELRDSYGNVVTTTTTTDSPITGLPGWYEFANLDAGTYIVKVADSNFAPGGVLEGWYASPPDRGNDTLDSDGNATTHQATVTLAMGEHNPTIDFGFFQTCIDLQKTGPVSVTIGANITYHFVVINCGDLVLHGGAHVYDLLINPYGNHEIWSGVVWPGEVYEFDKTYTTGTGGNGYKFDRTYISVTDSDDAGNSWTVQVKCPPPQDECGDLINIATAVGHPLHPDGYYVADVTDEASWTVHVECPPSPAALGDFVWKDLDGD
ncbi:MAG: SdrD B-like domain-containing protein, partial [Anaerolineae bacterium]